MRTPLSQFGQNKTAAEEKGFCFGDAVVYTLDPNDSNKKRPSSTGKKLFSAPKFIASHVPDSKKISEIESHTTKKSTITKPYNINERKPIKQIEVIEENPYIFGQIGESDSLADLDQDQNVFIDIQQANSHNIFKQRKQTPNFSEHNVGPRFNNEGKVIKRSILGNPEVFAKMQSILFKGTEQPIVVKDRKTSIMRGSTIKDKTVPNQINKSYTSLNSMSSIDETNENKKKKAPQSTISTKKNDNEPGKSHYATRIGKDELVQDIEKAEQRQITNTMNDKLLLKTLPPQEKRFFTKEQRILDKFNKTQELWEKKAQIVAKKCNRKVETCVMSQTDEYRLKLETAQTLDLLKNDDEKYGNKYWYITLRDYPKDLRPETDTVFKKSRVNFNRNNLEIVRKNEDLGHHKSPKKILTFYGDNEYLDQKLKNNQKKLNVILPTDDDNFVSMQVDNFHEFLNYIIIK